jgi:hypothetical protein
MTDKINYNKVPVFYCKKCLSLSVFSEDAEEPSEEGRTTDEFKYCLNCGEHHIGITTISVWDTMYQEKYGIKYLNETL